MDIIYCLNFYRGAFKFKFRQIVEKIYNFLDSPPIDHLRLFVNFCASKLIFLDKSEFVQAEDLSVYKTPGIIVNQSICEIITCLTPTLPYFVDQKAQLLDVFKYQNKVVSNIRQTF